MKPIIELTPEEVERADQLVASIIEQGRQEEVDANIQKNVRAIVALASDVLFTWPRISSKSRFENLPKIKEVAGLSQEAVGWLQSMEVDDAYAGDVDNQIRSMYKRMFHYIGSSFTPGGMRIHPIANLPSTELREMRRSIGTRLNFLLKKQQEKYKRCLENGDNKGTVMHGKQIRIGHDILSMVAADLESG